MVIKGLTYAFVPLRIPLTMIPARIVSLHLYNDARHVRLARL